MFYYKKLQLLIFVLFLSISNFISADTCLAKSTVEEAISWANARIGRTDWINYCQRFVGQAYGNSNGVFASAISAWNSAEGILGPKIVENDYSRVPRGALVFLQLLM